MYWHKHNPDYLLPFSPPVFTLLCTWSAPEKKQQENNTARYQNISALSLCSVLFGNYWDLEIFCSNFSLHNVIYINTGKRGKSEKIRLNKKKLNKNH